MVLVGSRAGRMSVAVEALCEGWFDDAALFPPGDAPMAAGVPAHAELRDLLGDALGPFVVPATRLDELARHNTGPDPLDISLIVSVADLAANVARVQADPSLLLRAVELSGVSGAPDAEHAVRVLGDVLPDGVPVAVELPRTDTRDEVLDVLAGTGTRAKLRTGGLRTELFPDAAELAATLSACVAREVAFKCTAGLHAALPHHDPATGFDHHGFLTVLLATDALVDGADEARAADLLMHTDGSAVAAQIAGWPLDRVRRGRGYFTSFGTCSVTDPVRDLEALGLRTALKRSPV